MSIHLPKIQTPPPLKAGDTIALVATARKIESDALLFAVQLFESWQLKVVWGETLNKSHHQFAGTDPERSSDLQQYVAQPDIKAIVCVRGGYGSMRIVDAIDFAPIMTIPKWLVGYSDVTVLHNHLYQQCHLASIHASMPINFATNSMESIESLRKALFGESLCYENIPTHPFNRIGMAYAPVVGGNLSLLCANIGTPSELDTSGKILFLEDLDEYLYHIDRMMVQLKRSNKLTNLAGLMVGGMTDMKDNAIPFGSNAYEIIAEHTTAYTYPVGFNFPFGHIDDNRAIIHGAMARLNVEEKHSSLLFQ
jgi:muramoyltetrapeptide carboxypeptidase